MMSIGVIAAIAYGLLAAVGGILGYLQARSQPSLISGLVSGALLLMGGLLWANGSAGGVGLAMGVTVGLIVVFIRRWMQTRKAMPALVMIAAGVVAFLVMVLSLTA
jgi:uncharacterized membrane protein (UPF0136 family)